MSLDITYCLRQLPIDRRTQGSRVPVPSVLEAAGHQVEIVPDGEIDLRPSDILWFHGNPNWYPQLLRQLAGTPQKHRPFVVAWHSEPLPPPRASGIARPWLDLREIAKIALVSSRATDVYTNYRCLRRMHEAGLPDLLVTTSRGRQEFLAERGLEARWVPLGTTPALGRDLGLERDIDVLMLGAQTIARRNRRIRRLRRAGIDVLFKGSWSDPATWGDERTELLNRTRITLNISRYEGDQSHARLMLGAVHRVLVISEPMYRPEPYEAGRHYVEATIDRMPEAIRHYLADETAREAIVEENHRLVTGELTMERSVTRVLELIQEHPAWQRRILSGT